MAASIIDGKKLAEDIRAQLAQRVRSLAAQGLVPGLAVILVGETPVPVAVMVTASALTVGASLAAVRTTVAPVSRGVTMTGVMTAVTPVGRPDTLTVRSATQLRRSISTNTAALSACSTLGVASSRESAIVCGSFCRWRKM